MKNCFSTVVLVLLNVFSLAAMTNCPAPAPASGMVVSEAETSIALRWEPVPGAVSYEVTRIDLSEGGDVQASMIGESELVQANLASGNEYQFEIRASYCSGGTYGQPLVLRAATTIIIVDVILQIECEEEPDIIYSGTVSSGDYTDLDIPLDDEGCYLFEFATLNLDPNMELGMVLTVNSQGGLTLYNFLGNVNDFQFSGNRPVEGKVIKDDGKEVLLLGANARKGKNNFETVFNWRQDMLLNILYCADCEIIKPDEGRPVGITVKETNEIKIYPNPVTNLLQLQIPKEGFIEIWDLMGRRWFDAESDAEQNFEIDSSNWPAGTYTLRWNDIDNNPPEIKLFLKL